MQVSSGNVMTATNLRTPHYVNRLHTLIEFPILIKHRGLLMMSCKQQPSILFYISHPAYFYLYKQTIQDLQKEHPVMVLYKKKEVLEELVQSLDCDSLNIFPQDRGESSFGIVRSILRRDWRIYRVAKKCHATMLVGTAPEIAQVGKLLGVPSVVVNDTDYRAAASFAWLTYPFADCILAPECTGTGRWAHKVIRYPGCHPAAYLHPRYFKPDAQVVRRINPGEGRYFILRLVKLSAHHDRGKSGIADDLASEIVRLLEPYGRVFISSERKLPESLQSHRLEIAAQELHSVLAFCDLLITDGQTVAAEAAALATRSIAYNDFINTMGYLRELEEKYELTTGLQANHPQQLLDKVREFVSKPHNRALWEQRRERLFSAATDVPRFLTWFIENYPFSAEEMRQNPHKSSEFLFIA